MSGQRVTGFSGHSPGSTAYRRLIAGLFFGGVATFAQLYSPQAVLPLMGQDLGVSAATAALAVSAATLGVAVGVVPWSLVADRLGRVPTMATGIITATLFGLLASASGDITVFLVLRLVEGLGLAAVPAIALTYLSEEVTARHAAAAAGSYIAGTTVGGLAGRLISGPVGDVLGWHAGVALVIVLCAACAALFLILIPRARGFVPAVNGPGRSPRVFVRLLLPLRSRVQLALYAQGFLLMGAFVAVYNYLGFALTAPPFLLPTAAVTLLFLAYLAGTFSSAWAGMLAVRFGRRRVLLFSVAIMVVGVLLLAVPTLWVILFGLIVFTAGFFGVHAIASGWAPAVAPSGTRAQAASLYSLCYYAGSSTFGWLLGFVFDGGGWLLFLGAVLGLCLVAAVVARSTLPRDVTS